MSMSPGAQARLRKRHHGLNQKRKDTKRALRALFENMVVYYPPEGINTALIPKGEYKIWLDILRKEST